MAKSKMKLFRRSRKGKVIAGVAQGMANYFGIDVTLFRLLWVFLLLPGGLPGVIPYLLFWIVVPEE